LADALAGAKIEEDAGDVIPGCACLGNGGALAPASICALAASSSNLRIGAW